MNRFALTAILLLSLFSSLAWADTAPRSMITELFHSQIDAIASEDYAQFMDHADANFRQAISQDQFDTLSASLSPRLADGYQSEYLGALNQDGFNVHLWKMTPSSSDSDHLVKMAMRENEIAGFWIQ
ncbi:hypothetical protein [Vreelandella titanicae]|uniref:hypothetical protein n=1 Tax=Vreelandella titanicae TaxID=664683 RepID=UPI003827D4E8